MRKLLELCQVGVYPSGDKTVPVTLKDLVESVETFKGSVPWTIGHAQNEKLPKMGGVESVAMLGDTLVGVVDFNDIGTKLFSENYFDQWSIALKRNAEGKRYLHHVAGLGEVPPAVKGLKVLEDLDFSDADLETVQFSEPIEDGDLVFLSSKKNHKENDVPKTVEELTSELNTEKNKNKTLERENEMLLSDKTASSEKLKSDMTARIKKAAEGKVPAGQIPELIALADALPVDEIELSDSDGKKEKLLPGAILERILTGMKPLIESETIVELSDSIKPLSQGTEDVSGLLACM